jgi:hypothetical protein
MTPEEINSLAQVNMEADAAINEFPAMTSPVIENIV